MSSNPDPIVILVEPQLGENIGMCARAMLNCGLRTLRLVAPRDGWPSDIARRTAADADIVIDGAEVFASVREAVADCQRVVATSARERSLPLPVWEAEEAAGEIKEAAAKGERVAVLFGPEASGLDREAVSRADALLRFSTNPDFSSLNLAQSVLLFGWEWRRAAVPSGRGKSQISAERADIDAFVERLEEELDQSGFFLTPELKPTSQRTLRNLFTRALPSLQEVKFLHGMLTALRRSNLQDRPEQD